MLDYIMYTFFDYSTNPLELAIGFMVMVLIFDSIFHLVGTLLSVFRGSSSWK